MSFWAASRLPRAQASRATRALAWGSMQTAEAQASAEVKPAAPLPASVPTVFRGADLALGTKLIAEHQCAQCHVRKVGGDGSSIYRPAGRINTPGFLRGMVEQCNSELNLGLFPEEVTAVAAVLNRDHYKFR